MELLVKEDVESSILADPPLIVEAGPVLKWAGGKGQLLDEIFARLPGVFEDYHEPFIGGASVFFAMRRAGLLRRGVYIADLNHRLVYLYQALRDRPLELLAELRELDKDKSKAAFLRARKEFNRGVADRRTGALTLFAGPAVSSPVRIAALFIFLNRLCFNGLFRENQDGEYNVAYDPAGITRDVVREEVILAASRALAGTNIAESDFSTTLALVRARAFVFMDPPYVPLSETSSFASYTADGFGMDRQIQLAKEYHRLDRLGARFMLCNSAHPAVLELYKGFNVQTVKATRNVNCKGDGRGEVDEVMILNYQPMTA